MSTLEKKDPLIKRFDYNAFLSLFLPMEFNCRAPTCPVEPTWPPPHPLLLTQRPAMPVLTPCTVNSGHKRHAGES